MTPAARVAAAIEVLDRILAGDPAERALTGWGRANRFAGSGDRAALRDLVFDALRCRASYAAAGGGLTGRGLMIGRCRAQGFDVSSLFTGEGHAPAPVTVDEIAQIPDAPAALDCPDWLMAPLQHSLGADFAPVMQALQQRAPVFLRVNLARTTVPEAISLLAQDGIVAQPHDLANTALEVTGNARKIQNGAAYLEGLVELQDAASQAVVAALPLRDGMKVLDHCAGGGGKTLAMAARAKLRLYAHDAMPRRLADLTLRAKRAKTKVDICDDPEKSAPYDLILMDVPCSGSGSWRRDPEGKWALTPEKLASTLQVQAEILDRCARMAGKDAVLAYATCSMLSVENDEQIQKFIDRTSGWSLQARHAFTPLQGGDGFFLALLKRN